MAKLCTLRTCENKFITNHLTLAAQRAVRQVNSNVRQKHKRALAFEKGEISDD